MPDLGDLNKSIFPLSPVKPPRKPQQERQRKSTDVLQRPRKRKKNPYEDDDPHIDEYA
jgi:hypothetical protein